MYNFARSFFKLSLIFYSPLLLAQNGLPPEKPIKELVLNQYTSKDGLISNNLTSVTQADDGFLWVTCFNGVLKFDGHEFELYDKENIPQLKSNGFYSTSMDDEHRLWFGTQGSGIFKYENNQFEKVGDSSVSLSIRKVFVDSKGYIWACSNNEGVYRGKDEAFNKLEFDVFDRIIVNDIAEDKAGNIWIATIGNGLIKYNENKIIQFTTKDGLKSNAVNTVYVHNNNDIYIGTLTGLNYLDGSQHVRTIHTPVDFEINDILVDRFENIWLATEQGLARINEGQDLFELFNEDEGLPGNQISGICFDHEQNLWLSTKKAGLIRLKDGNFSNYSKENGLPTNNVNIVVEYDNKYFVGTDDGLLSYIKHSNIYPFKFNTSLRGYGIRDIEIENENTLYLASYKGLLKIENGEEYLMTEKDGLTANDIRSIYRSADGTLWLATRSGGVNYIKPNGDINSYNRDNGLLVNYILAIEEDHNGNMVIGTHSGGLSIIDPAGNIKNYLVDGRKSGILVFNIHIDDNNVYWLATNIGLFRFEEGEIQEIKFDEVYKAETFFDIIKDKNDNFWLTTNIGVFQAEKADVANYLDKDIESVPLKHFDNNDGMVNRECTGATQSLLAKNGEIWIPTLGGVAIINPSELKINHKLPNVYITDFITDFTDQELSGNVSLLRVGPGILRYTISYTALSLAAPDKIQFKYKLEPVDKEWITTINKRETYYTNLKPGKYRFRVIASNNDGIWNEKGDALSFVVRPYFYEMPFFYIVTVLLLAAAVYFYIRKRFRKIEKANVELKKINADLDRFVYSASHDLRAPLNSILGLVDIAKMEGGAESKNQCLDLIKKSIGKLDSFIKDIIDYSRNQRAQLKHELIDFYEEVHEIFNELQYLDGRNVINKVVEIQNGEPFYNDKNRLNIILKNLISNAITYHNYGSNPFIKVKVDIKDNYANIEIEDNGSGIEDKHLEKIFDMFYRATDRGQGSGLGLFIVKETVEKLNGKIEVRSKSGKGTTFVISIPSLN